MHRALLSTPATIAALVLSAGLMAGCIEEPNPEPDKFPRGTHELIPELDTANNHVAAGQVTGRSLDQPIAFTHKRHVDVLGMECQFCHSEARKSKHAGVPPVQVCAGCHSQVQKVKDSPEIVKVMEYCQWDAASGRCTGDETIPWNKVHDLPDYVRFTHKRHVKAGVDCTECHGQVALMEGVRQEDGTVTGTMTREASLQMGWCLDCHASHPSIDKNYGDQSDLRRAELKDCWTCHN